MPEYVCVLLNHRADDHDLKVRVCATAESAAVAVEDEVGVTPPAEFLNRIAAIQRDTDAKTADNAGGWRMVAWTDIRRDDGEKISVAWLPVEAAAP